MSKYIDADWLKDNLYRRCTNEVKRNGYPEEYGLIDFIEMLNYAPVADVVEVVRCADCKYLGVKDFAYGYCKGRMTGILSPSDYCSYGEKQ